MAATAGLASLLGASAVRAQARDLQDSGRFEFTPFAAPASTPEMGVMLAAGALLSFKLDPELPRSQLAPLVGYSTTGSMVLGSGANFYFPGNALRLNFNGWYRRMPTDYYGVGYDAGATTPRGESTTHYTSNYWSFTPTLLVRTWRSLFAGVTVDVNHTLASDIAPQMAADPNFLRVGAEVMNVGVGPRLEWDSRDVPNDATRGLYLAASLVGYPHWLGSTAGWQKLTLDYRQYVPVAPNATLAWWVSANWAFLDVPWTDLPTVSNLRGYRDGQYRQRLVVSTVIEYRFRFLGAEGAISRHGMAFFAGAATLGSSPAKLEGVLPNAGLGYRFELQPRLNVRADLGVGVNSYAFYVTANEAF